MTIYRQKTESFDMPQSVLSDHIRKILDADPKCAWTEESGHGQNFFVEIKTPLWVQGFVVTILLKQQQALTTVTVHTTSEPWVTADPVDIFNRYVNSFFTAIECAMNQTLLRAADIPRSAVDTLLRPVGKGRGDPPHQLLRAVRKDNE